MEPVGNYFSRLISDERLLEKHGFSYWPDTEELARYVFENDAKIDAICAALGIEAQRDVRGCWKVYPKEAVV